MSIRNKRFLFPATIPDTLLYLSINNSPLTQINLNRFIPNIFRYFPTEISYQNLSCEPNTYEEALQCNVPYFTGEELLPFGQTLFDGIIYLIPFMEIDRILYLNEKQLLEQLIQFARLTEHQNDIYENGTAISCETYSIPWEATYDSQEGNKNISAKDVPLDFFNQVVSYQICFISYTPAQMESDLLKYKTTTQNLLNDPFGYIMQRTVYIFQQILLFCQQGLSQRQGYLPAEYVKYWSDPIRQRNFVSFYDPSFYYGNQFLNT